MASGWAQYRGSVAAAERHLDAAAGRLGAPCLTRTGAALRHRLRFSPKGGNRELEQLKKDREHEWN